MNPTKVITGRDTRWSYCNVWDPKSIDGGTPKYSVSLIIPKSDTVTVQKIRAAIEAAYRDGESKLRGNGKTVPPLIAIKNPLRDGDTERPDDPAYANAYFVNANSATRARRGRLRPQPDTNSQRGVLRRVWSRQYKLLRVQLQWEPRHRLRPEQPAKDTRRRTAGQPGVRRERLRGR